MALVPAHPGLWIFWLCHLRWWLLFCPGTVQSQQGYCLDSAPTFSCNFRSGQCLGFDFCLFPISSSNLGPSQVVSCDVGSGSALVCNFSSSLILGCSFKSAPCLDLNIYSSSILESQFWHRFPAWITACTLDSCWDAQLQAQPAQAYSWALSQFQVQPRRRLWLGDAVQQCYMWGREQAAVGEVAKAAISLLDMP